MKRIWVAAICIPLLTVMTPGANAKPNPEGPALKCADYQHHSDGSWSPAHQVTVQYADGSVGIGSNITFPAKGSYMGMPFALLLDLQCGYPAPVI